MSCESNPIDVFEKLFGSIGYNIQIIYENSKRVSYCERTHRVTDEKYILDISGKNIKIYCSCKKGALRALCDLKKRIDENTISDGEYICSPLFKVRGYIEGFYGNPWSH